MNDLTELTFDEGLDFVLRRDDLSVPTNDGFKADTAELLAYRRFQVNA